MGERRQTQTNADERGHTQTNADECMANCVRCVGGRNLKTHPDIRRLFKDFRDVLYAIYCLFLSSPMGGFEKKKKTLCILLISLDHKPVIKFVWP